MDQNQAVPANLNVLKGFKDKEHCPPAPMKLTY